MTYFAFLAVFLGSPLLVLSIVTIVDYVRGQWMPRAFDAISPWIVMLGLCVVAFLYTTPWDNYLVATGVWWYDPLLVNGLIIGYVPIEEYIFFLLQPIMTALFTLLLMRYIPLDPLQAEDDVARRIMTAITAVIWLVSVVLLGISLVSQAFKPVTYFSLELAWALIPVLIQVLFGGDILLRHARIVVPAILLTTIYLSVADMVAIGAGTWAIDPAQSLGIYLGVLPIEEFVFFLLTNTLVVFGLTLVLAEESQFRAKNLRRRLMR
ncbi:lycopene cyclase domain-containing protein [Phototrophicus methaneseepsis]|uniref:Lycopene cyclase domain-containing protein n=1 Tax=Phototrophicus methaneseepsis TaxID=2710758 RepID=A0A7S8IDB8_9CHLR|nr:lycopene cyclase domain-containing protein [Phototrophicus methaneseepsis]QPC81402.1 lycopene cyclase domain-containing protein [Phototrophicus methaneseepsis]